jgi:hypothetical protein
VRWRERRTLRQPLARDRELLELAAGLRATLRNAEETHGGEDAHDKDDPEAQGAS